MKDCSSLHLSHVHYGGELELSANFVSKDFHGMIAYVIMNILTGKRSKVSWTMIILSILFVLKYIYIK